MRELTNNQVAMVSGGTITSAFVGLGFGLSSGLASGAIAGTIWGFRIGGYVGAAVGLVVGVGYVLATEYDF